jgi:threonine aldolase
MFCLSKGLGAPVGSMLVGDEGFITEARRVRKMFGGGMRQAGVLAAAGLVALDEVLPLLADDNRRARRLADHLATIDSIELDPETVETNIVFFGLAPAAGMDAGELAAALAERGVLCHPLGGDSIRMVTHYHIDDADIDRAAEITRQVFDTTG